MWSGFFSQFLKIFRPQRMFVLASVSFVEVKGGKESHRKFEKAGERPVTLTSHNKEISRIVEITVRKAWEKGQR